MAPPVAGQCKVDPPTGVSADIYAPLALDADAGMLPAAFVAGDPIRKILGALIESVAKGIVAAVASGGASTEGDGSQLYTGSLGNITDANWHTIVTIPAGAVGGDGAASAWTGIWMLNITATSAAGFGFNVGMAWNVPCPVAKGFAVLGGSLFATAQGTTSSLGTFAYQGVQNGSDIDVQVKAWDGGAACKVRVTARLETRTDR